MLLQILMGQVIDEVHLELLNQEENIRFQVSLFPNYPFRTIFLNLNSYLAHFHLPCVLIEQIYRPFQIIKLVDVGKLFHRIGKVVMDFEMFFFLKVSCTKLSPPMITATASSAATCAK